MNTTSAIRWLLAGTLVSFVIWSVLIAAEKYTPEALDRARNRMVDEEVIGAGIKNSRIIQAMRMTPRHEFVPTTMIDRAYFDMSLPIGDHQTISPPMLVGYMSEQLDPQPNDRVLEIGTGSGYQAAVLSPLVKEVDSIEIVESLGERAERTRMRLNFKNMFTKIGDGKVGWPQPVQRFATGIRNAIGKILSLNIFQFSDGSSTPTA